MSAVARNGADAYAVAVLCEGTVVDNVPRRISRIRREGVIRCCVTDRRQYSSDLPQGGLEIPCLLLFEGEVRKATNRLHIAQQRHL